MMVRIFGILLGLELPAEENIETVFRSLAFSSHLEEKIALTEFFIVHRKNERDHIRLTVSNFLKFCKTPRDRSDFLIGLNIGLEFWSRFWSNVSLEARCLMRLYMRQNDLEFRIVLLGSFVSQIGSHFLTLALASYVLITTGSAVNSGMVFVVTYLPSILVGSALGAIVDRHISKRLLILNESLSVLAIWAGCLYPLLSSHSDCCDNFDS